jgi:ABC-type bacteriocin/lantibiotic exporter with double-glycine peptidase domain
MQRVAIARAILAEPARRIIVWDEPTSALDNITAKKVIEYFHGQKATKIIITFVSTFLSCMVYI